MILNQAGRQPTGKELELLGESFKERFGITDEEVNDYQIWATVYDNYITDSPGYAGKILSVLYSGSPDFYEVYCWKHGKWEYLPQGFQLGRVIRLSLPNG